MSAALVVLSLALAAALAALWQERRRNAEGRISQKAWQSLMRAEDELEGLLARHPPGSEEASALGSALQMKRALDRLRSGARHDIHALAKPEVHLAALSQRGVDYQVLDTAIAQLDLAAIQNAGLLSDAGSVLGGPHAFAAAVSREALRLYLLPENSPWAAPTLRWFLRLPEEATLILIHVQESKPPIQIETQSGHAS